MRKDYDKALELYEQALQEDPATPATRWRCQRVRFQAGAGARRRRAEAARGGQA